MQCFWEGGRVLFGSCSIHFSVMFYRQIFQKLHNALAARLQSYSRSVFVIVWAQRLNKGMVPPDLKGTYTWKCWCICQSVCWFSVSLLVLGQVLLLRHPAGTAEQQCAGLSALCSTKGVVSPVYVAIQTKGKLLMVEMRKKIFRLASQVP